MYDLLSLTRTSLNHTSKTGPSTDEFKAQSAWSLCNGRFHNTQSGERFMTHDDVIKWKHFPPYWPFVRGIHRLPVNSPHKGQWHGALMFVFFHLCLNNRLSKQSWGWWFETPSHNDFIVMHMFWIKIIIASDNVLLRCYTLINLYQPDIYFLQDNKL